MNTRLKQFLAAENITQAQFADTLNVVRASVSHILSGRNNPSFDFIKAMMANYPALNMEWLMFGKGKMYRTPLPDGDHVQDMPHALDTDESQQTLFSEIEEKTEQLSSNNESIPLDTNTQIIVNQRKVSKVIILFDDGSYQEM
jgi:transcriptional regulator with XRE-family HTH domain